MLRHSLHPLKDVGLLCFKGEGAAMGLDSDRQRQQEAAAAMGWEQKKQWARSIRIQWRPADCRDGTSHAQDPQFNASPTWSA